MFDIVKFRAWLRASGSNLFLDESKLQAQSLKVEARAFWTFKQGFTQKNKAAWNFDML